MKDESTIPNVRVNQIFLVQLAYLALCKSSMPSIAACLIDCLKVESRKAGYREKSHIWLTALGVPAPG